MKQKEPPITQTMVCTTEDSEYTFIPTLELYSVDKQAIPNVAKEIASCEFCIWAKHKPTCRASRITNNNLVLSQIVLPVFDPEGTGRFKVPENTWLDIMVTCDDLRRYDKGIKLMQASVEAFSDPKMFKRFEEAMDDDRDAGEWEGCIPNPMPFPDQ
jgi:hypothetical protein